MSISPTSASRRARRVATCALVVGLALAMSLPWCVAAHAATTTMTLQPAPTAVDDSYLREDNVTENNATKPDLRVRASSDQHDRNTVLKITPSGLSGKTVLRAWLELYQSAGSSSTTLDARIYPLTESWTESIVTWATRDRLLINTPWSTPGGTRSDSWSDRAIVSSSNTGTTTRWQVGPIVQAWNTGSIPNDGFLIEPVRGGVGREVSFSSSDNGTASLRPKLIIQYTDEPPAIRSGIAEIQPRNVREGSHDVPLTVWVDVDAQGATPSGTATGFDALILTHEGALAVTKIDRFVVGGATISPSTLSWTDDGQAVTIRFPRVQVNGLVQLDFRADILKPAATSGYDLPISLDDTTTPGAWSQQLWPGNGDRVAGNGDDWILNVINTPPVSIDLTPNAAQIVNRTCLSLGLNGRDALGNVFPLQPDSVVILPGTAGTISGSLTFCAAAPGSAKLIACYGSLRDTSVIDVQPERLTQLQSVTLRDRALAPTSVLSPRDTMFLDVLLSDGDGAQDVKQIDFELQHPLAAGSPSSPAYGASFRWTRSATPAWTLEHPTGSSWAVLPALCAIDSQTDTTGPVLARLALVVGRIARASTSEWKATVSAWSATPADTASASLAGLQVPVRLSIGTQETLGAFSAGLPGTSGLPLETPPSARIHFNLEANAAFQLEALASDLVGAASPSDTLHVGSPANRLHAGLGPDRTASLPVGTVWSAVGSSLAPETEDPLSSDLYLWIDHPAAIPAQDYLGTLAFRLDGGAQPDTSVSGRLTLRASVVNAGLAAHLGLAEVTPHSVTAGSHGQAFTIYLLPVLQASDTGVDRVRVSVPEGYGTVAISQVRVGGSPVSYQDHSVPGLADVTLNAKVVASQLIELQLTADAPLDLDPEGSSFVVVYDDQSTPVSPQTATEGDANGQADGNNTVVRVVPGPLARIVISPAQTEMFRDSSLAFAAEGQDSLGHPVAATPAWSVEGGVGTVSASGLFTATATGTGRIIARAGAFADSAAVTVFPPRAIAVRSVVGPATVHQGESGVTLHVNLENQAQVPVFLDSLELHFGRARPDDADADFVVTQAPQSVSLAPGARVALSFTVDVALAALVAPLAVQATASGVEDGSGIRLRDTSPDTSLALGVLPSDIEVAALQGTAAVRPGSRDGLLLTLRVTNRYPEARFLESFALTNRTNGPGDRDQLDAELGDVSLYRDDGDGLLDVSRDTLLLKTVALDGAVNFAPLHAAFQGASSGYLFVAVSPPLVARDGDLLDVELASPEDVQFAPQVLYRNGWPVSAPGGRVIDGMVAAQIQVRAVGPAAVHPSATDQLAFDVLLPGNGYTPDGLTALGLINLGSAASSDIAQLRAWSDDGDGIFNATNDAPMGAFAYVGGGRWQLSGLSLAVPATGRRVFVTASLAATATHNATIKLALPAGDDPGARMASGDSGPLDVDAANPSLLTVSDLDRVAVVALALPAGTVIRGAKQVTLGSYSLTNNYATDRTLTSLTVANATSGPGTVAERDAEIRLISLRLDGDGDGVLGDPSVDPVLGTTFFQGGTAAFAGLHLVLAPFQGRQLFVVADVSSEGARDGDRIGCSVSGPASFDFVEATALSGIWPLDSAARWTIDGFAAAQVTRRSAAAAVIGPGDGPILALDLVVPRNGYSPDILRGIRLANLGSAGAGDLASVQLWQDGGNGIFDAGGDDVLLGPLTTSGGEWTSPLLSQSVDGSGLRLFVAVTVAATPAESSTVRFQVPVGGIEMASDDDGPLDVPIDNPDVILISSAPLLATLGTVRASTVGQTVTVSMAVRNTSGETIRGITPAPLTWSGSAFFQPVSGPIPPTFDLAPAQIDTFEWRLLADQPGDARFLGAAAGTGDPSGLARRAPPASSSLHQVYLAAQTLELTPIQTMPVRVNRGQADIVPFSLTLANPGGPSASDVSIERLRIRIENDAGAPVVPASLVDRVTVNEGTNVYAVKTALESSGANVDIAFSTPATVTGTQPATLSLRLDIAPTTLVSAFRVVIEDSSALGAQDVTSGAPVTAIVSGGAFPVRSDLTSVVSEATGLEIAAAATQDTTRVGRGAQAVTLMRFRLTNQGVSGISSSVRLTSMGLVLVDSAGAPLITPGARVTSLRLMDGGQTLAARTVAPADPESLSLLLEPRLDLPANSPLDVALVADVALAAPYGRFGARLLDSTLVDASDVNTREAVPAFFEPDTIRGGLIKVEAPAETLMLASTPSMPASVMIGQTDVMVMSVRLRHPGGAEKARLRLDAWSFDCLDHLGRPLVPAAFLSRLRVRWNGSVAADLTDFPSTGNRVSVPLGARMIEPGDTVRVDVSIDVDATAPAGFLQLVAPSLEARDANSSVLASVLGEPGTVLPPVSGLAHLVAPARELAVGLVSAMPAALAPDGRAVKVATLTLRSADSESSGPIQLDHLLLQGRDRAMVATAIGTVASRIEAWHQGVLWAQSGVLTPDSVSAWLAAPASLSIDPGDTVALEIRLVTRLGAAAASLALGVDGSGIGVIQPGSALLAINVRPEQGSAFPLWTEAGSISGASLTDSYSNFPNPFAAGRQSTSFVYYLPGPGRVSLRILTLRGEPVATLLDRVPRTEGLQQADSWSGRNERGLVVYNGVYVAELDVQFDDGQVAHVLRKVAVVR